MKHLFLVLLTTATFLTYAQTNTINSDDVIDTLYTSDATINNADHTNATYYLTSASGAVPIVFKPTVVATGEGPDQGQGLDTDYDTLVVDVSFSWRTNGGPGNYSVKLFVDGEEVSEITGIGINSDYVKRTFSNIKIPETMDSLHIQATNGWGLMRDVEFEKVSPTITALVEGVSNQGVNEFSIYPNPAVSGEQMTIQIDNELVPTIEAIEVLNMSGQVVTSFSSIQDMNTAALTRGVYYVNIKTTEGFMKVKKLFIK